MPSMAAIVSEMLRSSGWLRRTTALLELGSGSDVVLGVLGDLGGLGSHVRCWSVRVGFRGFLTSPELPWTMGWPSMGPFWLSPPLRGIVIDVGGLGWVLEGVVMVVLLNCNGVRINGQLPFLYSSRSRCCLQSAWWGDDVASVIVDRTADHSHFFGGALQPPAGT